MLWRWGGSGIEELNAFFLHPQIGFDVEMGCARIFMAEPKGDDFQGNSCLQEVHRRGVAQDVWRDLATDKGRTIFRGAPHSQHQPKGRSVTGKGYSAAVGKNRLIRYDLVGLAPLLQMSEGLRPKRNGSEFSSFAA